MTIMSRQIMGHVHALANDVLRWKIFPVLRNDEVTISIKYNELLILFGNNLRNKYMQPHQYDMIRAHLRLLGRFKWKILDPQFYDAAVKSVYECAGYDQVTHIFKAPVFTTSLGTLLKKCLRQQKAESI